jgi:hypothetical protein
MTAQDALAEVHEFARGAARWGRSSCSAGLLGAEAPDALKEISEMASTPHDGVAGS